MKRKNKYLLLMLYLLIMAVTTSNSQPSVKLFTLKNINDSTLAYRIKLTNNTDTNYYFYHSWTYFVIDSSQLIIGYPSENYYSNFLTLFQEISKPFKVLMHLSTRGRRNMEFFKVPSKDSVDIFLTVNDSTVNKDFQQTLAMSFCTQTGYDLLLAKIKNKATVVLKNGNNLYVRMTQQDIMTTPRKRQFNRSDTQFIADLLHNIMIVNVYAKTEEN